MQDPKWSPVWAGWKQEVGMETKATLLDNQVLENASEGLEGVLYRVWEMLKDRAPATQTLAQKVEQLTRSQSNDYALAQSQLILGVCALDQARAEEAIERLTLALARFRWFNDPEREWFTLAAIAQAWYQLDDYDQMHETLIAAKAIPVPGTSEKFAWLDRIGMIR